MVSTTQLRLYTNAGCVSGLNPAQTNCNEAVHSLKRLISLPGHRLVPMYHIILQDQGSVTRRQNNAGRLVGRPLLVLGSFTISYPHPRSAWWCIPANMQVTHQNPSPHQSARTIPALLFIHIAGRNPSIWPNYP